MFESGPLLGFCNGEVATWHVSSIGAQDYIQTTTFYGHTFELNERTEDFLSLYPMTGETINMNMDNIGQSRAYNDFLCCSVYCNIPSVEILYLKLLHVKMIRDAGKWVVLPKERA